MELLFYMGVAMVDTVKPTKEKVREYMHRRQADHRPPQTQEEIRRQLGWDLIEMERVENSRSVWQRPDR